MSQLDWIVLLLTIFAIVIYGLWKSRDTNSTEKYLHGTKSLPWWTIGLSIMATQASAITFLSTPGQAYMDGMRFAQFYIGLPIAMVLLCVFVLPVYYRLNVFTAYEYLESRFNVQVRQLAAFLFLVQRGLAAGITIYAPAIIFSKIMGWDLGWTSVAMGILVLIYTVAGGTDAVSQTQKQQMIIIMTGMVIAFGIILDKLPDGIGLNESLHIAGDLGKMNLISLEFNLSDRYNIWSGILGGTFLFLSYFGTDQSQVQRYLSGKSLTESRLGLLFNGLIKVPMQVFILLVGLMVFVFYQFENPPLHFNESNRIAVMKTDYADSYRTLETEYATVLAQKKELLTNEYKSTDVPVPVQSQLKDMDEQTAALRQKAKDVIKAAAPQANTEDADYVFITFITQQLPVGLVGLLIAVILSAAMSSIASEVNALATTSMVDFYKRSFVRHQTDKHYLMASKVLTVVWGLLAMSFAIFASLFDNLIEAVNIIGSLFYGTVLGIFVVAFFIKYVGSRAVLIAAVISELCIMLFFYLESIGKMSLGYLWYNLIGCFLVVVLSISLQFIQRKPVSM